MLESSDYSWEAEALQEEGEEAVLAAEKEKVQMDGLWIRFTATLLLSLFQLTIYHNVLDRVSSMAVPWVLFSAVWWCIFQLN